MKKISNNALRPCGALSALAVALLLCGCGPSGNHYTGTYGPPPSGTVTPPPPTTVTPPAPPSTVVTPGLAPNGDMIDNAAIYAAPNVPHSSLVRESDLALMTQAGPEIGVASTKAFTTQLMVMAQLAILLARRQGVDLAREHEYVDQLNRSCQLVDQVLELNATIKALAGQFVNRQHALFLGRGAMYPVAMEGALKLKEISYIHAEAYPAGELKHGPLALVDQDMPVVALAANDSLLGKLKSNLEEVRARGGKVFVFADTDAGLVSEPGMTVINLPHAPALTRPIVYTLPLQLLAYHVAVLKGTDVDKPRNLAKSVTVE